MGLIQYAESELARLSHTGNRREDEMNEGASDDVMELIRVLEGQRHSGGSAKYVLKLFDRVARFLPATPLVSDDADWAMPKLLDEDTQTVISTNKRYPYLKRVSCYNAPTEYRDYNVIISDDHGATWFRDDAFYKLVDLPYIPTAEPYCIFIERHGFGRFTVVGENEEYPMAQVLKSYGLEVR